MPSKSKKQQNFMAAVANNPKFAKKAGVPQSVGKDYEKADKMKGMKEYQAGGMPMGMKKQGYNDRLDESMGGRNGPAMQGMQARRDESEGMERAMGKRKFAGDKAMKFQRGGPMPAGMANPQAGVANAPPPPMGERKQAYTRLGHETQAEAIARGEAADARRAPRTKETAMRGAAARRSGGSTPRGMKKGGKVRGSGCATKGTRAAKMVTMKGS